MTSSRVILRSGLGCVFVLLTACTAEQSSGDGGRRDTGTPRSDGALTDGATGESGADAFVGVDAIDPSQRALLSIAIEPAMASLTSTDGAMPTQMFRVVGTRRDGTTSMLAGGTWTLSADTLGSISSAGVFTANGLAGGSVNVRVEVPNSDGTMLQGAATVRVQVDRTVRGMGVPDDIASRFAGPAMTVMDPARTPALLYPLEGAVMPGNVLAPEVQWSLGGAPGDFYRVRFEHGAGSLTGYVAHTGGAFRASWRPDEASWRSVLDSLRAGGSVVVGLQRYEGSTSTLLDAGTRTFRLAPGRVAGTIYYWDLDAGRLQRISPNTGAATVAIPSPPPRPAMGSPQDGNRCVACHTVSRTGRYLSATLWGGNEAGAVFDLTADLTTDPAPTLFTPSLSNNYNYATFNPDATRLLVNVSRAFRLLDPRTGMSVAARGLPSGGAAQPDWSPDGTHLAYVQYRGDSWEIDYEDGDLTVVPVEPMDSFGAARTVSMGASLATSPEGGRADSHPSWAPDSRLIAFAHGRHSRSVTRGPMNAEIRQPGALYLATRDGGAAQRLNNANGGAMGADSYWPTFSPFETPAIEGEGRTFWLAFYSRRDYGNERAGSRGSGRRQLWVTAVRSNVSGSADPSFVPYWLPGQQVSTDNMAAFWAAEACRRNGEQCRTAGDCCSGRCSASGVCEPPPAAECRREAATCSADADCCTGLRCIGNVCGAPPG